MKKLFGLLFLIVISMSMIGCAADKPEGAVSRFFDAGKNFDIKKMKAQLNPNDKNNNETLSNSFNGKEDDYQKYFLEYLKTNASKIEYSIKETKVEGDNAVVTVSAKYIDGGPVLKETVREVLREAFANAFSGVELTEEATRKMVLEILTSKLKDVQPTTIEKTVKIDCVRIDKKWYIANTTDELLDVFTSNFITTGKEYQEAFSSVEE